MISAAIALWPSPSPSTTPAAIAMTFFSAPPISTPATSSLAYSRRARPAELLLDPPRPRHHGTRPAPRPAGRARPRPRSWAPTARRPASGRRSPPRSPATSAEGDSASSPFVALTMTASRLRRRRSGSNARRAGRATAPRRPRTAAPVSAVTHRRRRHDTRRQQDVRADSAGCERVRTSRRRACVARPQPNVRDRRERDGPRAPCPSCRHPAPRSRLIARAPIRRSVPSEQPAQVGAMTEENQRCRCRRRPAPRRGVRPPSQATGGSATVAAIDPSET